MYSEERHGSETVTAAATPSDDGERSFQAEHAAGAGVGPTSGKNGKEEPGCDPDLSLYQSLAASDSSTGDGTRFERRQTTPRSTSPSETAATHSSLAETQLVTSSPCLQASLSQVSFSMTPEASVELDHSPDIDTSKQGDSLHSQERTVRDDTPGSTTGTDTDSDQSAEKDIPHVPSDTFSALHKTDNCDSKIAKEISNKNLTRTADVDSEGTRFEIIGSSSYREDQLESRINTIDGFRPRESRRKSSGKARERSVDARPGQDSITDRPRSPPRHRLLPLFPARVVAYILHWIWIEMIFCDVTQERGLLPPSFFVHYPTLAAERQGSIIWRLYAWRSFVVKLRLVCRRWKDIGGSDSNQTRLFQANTER